jgi:hypothetical protein
MITQMVKRTRYCTGSLQDIAGFAVSWLVLLCLRDEWAEVHAADPDWDDEICTRCLRDFTPFGR